MRVAVVDAGFMNVDRISVFDSLRLLGTHNVVFPGRSVFIGDDHGTKVLSCLAADAPGLMVGTAPQAEYWLIKSEDSRSEFPIEEDYWTQLWNLPIAWGDGWCLFFVWGYFLFLM